MRAALAAVVVVVVLLGALAGWLAGTRGAVAIDGFAAAAALETRR